MDGPFGLLFVGCRYHTERYFRSFYVTRRQINRLEMSTSSWLKILAVCVGKSIYFYLKVFIRCIPVSVYVRMALHLSGSEMEPARYVQILLKYVCFISHY